MTITPRRSVLYMPSSNDRAIQKAGEGLLEADTLILDLEDAVAVDQKIATRSKLTHALETYQFGQAEVVVRVNALDTPWGEDDLLAFANSKADAICIPKVESLRGLQKVIAILESESDYDTPLWVMAETPLGITHIDDIVSGSDRICTLLMGTSDLSKELRIPHSVNRNGLLYSLSRAVIAARAANIDIVDGVFLDLSDDSGFEASCRQGLELGFDGKSLIHPKQITAANEVFSPNAEAIAEAREITQAWETCKAEGQGVTVVRGKLVESLHVEQAQRILAYQAAIEHRALS